MNKTSISLLLCVAIIAGDAVAQDPTTPRVSKNYFPVSVQFTPVPSGKGWRDGFQAYQVPLYKRVLSK